LRQLVWSNQHSPIPDEHSGFFLITIYNLRCDESVNLARVAEQV